MSRSPSLTPSLPLLSPASRFVRRYMERKLQFKAAEAIRNITLTTDGFGAAFDVPSDMVDEFIKGE